MKDLAMNLLVRRILFNILTSYIIMFKQTWKSDRLYETKLFKHVKNAKMLCHYFP